MTHFCWIIKNISLKLYILDSPQDSVFLPSIDSQLEIPRQERLLPIGQQNKDVSQLIDKVKLALGINNETSKSIEVQKRREGDEAPIVHSPRRLIKQVALESPPNQGDLENNICKDFNLDNKSMLSR